MRATSASLRRTSRLLADGREIIYFDDTPGAPERTVDDTRELGERAAAGHVRFDALVGDWVAVAGHRMNRTLLPPRESCPLCPTGRGPLPSEVPDSDYDVVVIENRFPSYAPVALDDAPGTAPSSTGRRWAAPRSSASPATTTRSSPPSPHAGCAP